jgi:lambda repressor-like predicted transcriptional regulator
MEPKDIKAAISKAGTSQSAIAAYLGVHVSVVNGVVLKKTRNQRVEAELLKITSKPLYDTPVKRGPRKTVWNGRVQVAA